MNDTPMTMRQLIATLALLNKIARRLGSPVHWTTKTEARDEWNKIVNVSSGYKFCLIGALKYETQYY